MELSWLQSLVMGLFSGLTDILPVSSQAHQTLLLTFFGGTQIHPALRLVMHAAVVITLLFSCWGQIGRIRRQVRISRQPKRRRTRAIDMAAFLDSRIIQTSVWTIVPAVLLYGITSRLQGSLLWLAVLSLLNAVILYLPGLFPTADKDSRLVTPGESLLMGIGTGAAVLPGISSVGVSYSVGILHGVDRTYMIHLSLMMHMVFTVGLMLHDVLDLLTMGSLALDGGAMLCCGLGACAAAAGTALGVRILKRVAGKAGLTGFSFYSFGVALLSFILYLVL
ncbi:MAG: hypothetical protein IJZ39_09840 [Oscillospiraceae bacterium]|nr:hypothetical protein [Oscillospiraceae bacterium]